LVSSPPFRSPQMTWSYSRPPPLPRDHCHTSVAIELLFVMVQSLKGHLF
jgi:hypothetical protein